MINTFQTKRAVAATVVAGTSIPATFWYFFKNSVGHTVSEALADPFSWSTTAYVASFVVLISSFVAFYMLSQPGERQFVLLEVVMTAVGAALVMFSLQSRIVAFVCVIIAIALAKLFGTDAPSTLGDTSAILNQSAFPPVQQQPSTTQREQLDTTVVKQIFSPNVKSPNSFAALRQRLSMPGMKSPTASLDGPLYQHPNIRPAVLPIRLLTAEEYERQGRVESGHAMDELRQNIVSSPDWPDQLNRLSDPKKMIKFLAGDRVRRDISVVKEVGDDEEIIFSESDDDTEDEERDPETTIPLRLPGPPRAPPSWIASTPAAPRNLSKATPAVTASKRLAISVDSISSLTDAQLRTELVKYGIHASVNQLVRKLHLYTFIEFIHINHNLSVAKNMRSGVAQKTSRVTMKNIIDDVLLLD